MKRFMILLMMILALQGAFAITGYDIIDSLNEGEVKTYTINGLDYETALVFITDTNPSEREVKFSVNGILTNTLFEGETDTFTINGVDYELTLLFVSDTDNAEVKASINGVLTNALKEGETQILPISGNDLELTVVFIGDVPTIHDETKFSVNGELTNALRVGETYIFQDGASINIHEIDASAQTASFGLNGGTTGSVPVEPDPVHDVDVKDTLFEGGSSSYIIDGHEYDTTVVYVSDPGQPLGVKFNINGELTDVLGMGLAYTLGNGAEIVVFNIFSDARTGSVTFGINRAEAGSVDPVPHKPPVIEPINLPVSADGFVIVVGERAPRSDILDAVALAKAVQTSYDVSLGASILDTDAYERARKDPQWIHDNTVVVLHKKRALISIGNDVGREQKKLLSVAARHLDVEGFKTVQKSSLYMSLKHLFVEEMLRHVDGESSYGNPVPTDTTVCGQALTPAWNLDTGRCIVYPNTCIPDGWIRVDTCEQDTGSLPVPPLVDPTPLCDSGCLKGDRCLPIGTRVANGNAEYCTIDGTFAQQRVDGTRCQNNYECVSNQCLNAVCTSLEKEVRETQGLLKRILGFFSSWFT